MMTLGRAVGPGPSRVSRSNTRNRSATGVRIVGTTDVFTPAESP